MASYPKVEKLNLALRSGEILEVDAVRVTELNAARGLVRVEWEVGEAIHEEKVIYHKRWEGSLRMLLRRPSGKPLNAWLEGILS